MNGNIVAPSLIIKKTQKKGINPSVDAKIIL